MGKKLDNSLRIKYETGSQQAASLNQLQLKCEQRCRLIIQEKQTWQAAAYIRLSQILRGAATSEQQGQVSFGEMILFFWKSF